MAATAEGVLGPSELDELLAPVALYPDAVLTQILVASTYPLDVVKAARLIDQTAALDADARADAVNAEEWDPSLQVLAAGFPSLVTRMGEDLEWTEALGDAVLAQTDDVLEAVQRLRGQASVVGNLESNEAQVVEVDDGAISIMPADPEVVYVPTYDPTLAYTTPAPAVVSAPTYSITSILTTGAIAFGTALLVDEIFDDDDDWYGYWGSPHIDWDEGDFDARPNIDIDREVDIDGDVTIDRGRFTGTIDRSNLTGERLGSVDPARLEAAREGGWQPDPDREQAARDRIAASKGGGGDAARARIEAGRPDAAQRAAARGRLEARTGGAALAPSGQRQELSALPRSGSTLQSRPESSRSVRAASERGTTSLQGQRSRQISPAPSRSQQISRSSQPTQMARPSPSRSSALQRNSSASRAKAASSRGHSSRSRSGGGRRR
jgi:hypothetical protein